MALPSGLVDSRIKAAIDAAASGPSDAATALARANQAPVKVAAPASAGAAGVAGTWSFDSGFIYICTATNTWKRVAIATW